MARVGKECSQGAPWGTTGLARDSDTHDLDLGHLLSDPGQCLQCSEPHFPRL